MTKHAGKAISTRGAAPAARTIQPSASGARRPTSPIRNTTPTKASKPDSAKPTRKTTRLLAAILNKATVRDLEAAINGDDKTNDICAALTARKDGTLRDRLTRLMDDIDFVRDQKVPPAVGQASLPTAQEVAAARAGAAKGYVASVRTAIAKTRAYLGLVAQPEVVDSAFWRQFGAHYGNALLQRQCGKPPEVVQTESLSSFKFMIRWDYFFSMIFQARGPFGAKATEIFGEAFRRIVSDERIQYLEWAAYMLATASIETGDFRSLTEGPSSKPYAQKLTYMCADRQYERELYGRGLIQLTGIPTSKTGPNLGAYGATSNAIFGAVKPGSTLDVLRRSVAKDIIDPTCILVAHPELLVNNSEIAYEALVQGLLFGTLHASCEYDAASKTQRVGVDPRFLLKEYVKPLQEKVLVFIQDPDFGLLSPQWSSYVDARRIVNSQDRAQLIADRACEYEMAFRHALFQVPGTGTTRKVFKLTYGALP